MSTTTPPVQGLRATTGLELRPMLGEGGDAVTALTAYLFLLLAIPSALRLSALGGVGYPAAMLAMLLGLWWCWSTVRGARRGAPAEATRITLYLFVAAVITSYAFAMHRALPAVEGRQADIGLLRTAVFASVVLVVCDGVATWNRFLTLCRRMAVAGGLFAALGLAQFFTKASLIGWISLPGFEAAQASGVIERGEFTRASATAIHPLEYAAGLAVFLPIALTIAIYDTRRHPLLRWLPPLLIGTAMILSGSRSGYLGLVISVAVLAFSWSRRIIAAVCAAGVALMVLVFVTIPGMIGTIRGLIFNTSNDPSAISRSGSYALAEEFFLRSPVVGRGFGTFLPTYRILDNGLLLLLMETGLLGLGCFLALLVAAAASSIRARRRHPEVLPRQLGQAVAAAVVVGGCLTFFFDALGFPISVGTLSVAVGLCGAYSRLSRAVETQPTSS